MTVPSLLRNVQGISNTAQGAVDVLGRVTGGSFWSQLKPASYRGARFVVTDGRATIGRRNAVHEYPFRDMPWVEDLGRAARRIHVTGFLVGDDVIAQRDRLIKACEAKGSDRGDELVHPTLGVRQVALMDFSCSERWDQGRVFELQFSFIEQGQRIYPTTAASPAGAQSAAAALLDRAGVAAYAKRAVAALQQGAAVANAAAREAAAYAAQALQSTTDATSLFNLAAGLPGEFGRLLGQSRGVAVGQVATTSTAVTVADLVGVAAAARGAVRAAAGGLTDAGVALGPSTTAGLASAAQVLADAVRVAAPTPGDAVRSLLALIAYPGVLDGTGATLTAQRATSDVQRRAATAALVRAAADYRPVSVNDAMAVRAAVLAAIDAEVTVAGSQGEDDVYQSLRATRAATVQALNAAGAGLPTLVTVTTPLPVPSLVLAQRLYRDAGRADELVARAMPAHPAFMPTKFQALAE